MLENYEVLAPYIKSAFILFLSPFFAVLSMNLLYLIKKRSYIETSLTYKKIGKVSGQDFGTFFPSRSDSFSLQLSFLRIFVSMSLAGFSFSGSFGNSLDGVIKR